MIDMHPSVFFLAAALLVFILPLAARQIILVIAAAGALILVLLHAPGTWSLKSETLAYTFTWIRLDKLTRLFALAFTFFALLANIYALHSRNRWQTAAAQLYAGAAIAALLAGDWVTLFIFWELMALASAVLIYNPARTNSIPALNRYLLVHLAGGLFFFTGVLLRLVEGQSMGVGPLALSLSGGCILTGLLINAAIVPFHAWLPDAYPEGTPSGSVYLSCFTTKTAIFVLAQSFTGADFLIYLGAFTALYGVIYALIENDIRRLLAYHIVCQMGYMICGIGLGTPLGVDAGAAHAVGNILFKGLLFMATGALLFHTGKTKLTELGGLVQTQKFLFALYMIGAFAISGVPLLNGFVSKSLLIEAAAEKHVIWLEWILMIVAAGTFLSIAIKLAGFAFGGTAQNTNHAGTASISIPSNMYVAMTLAAIACIAVGLFPSLLFDLLPFGAHVAVYSAKHILHTLELLTGTYLAFLLFKKHIQPHAGVSLDVDWFYRKGAQLFVARICHPLAWLQACVQKGWSLGIQSGVYLLDLIFPHQKFEPVERPLLFMVAAFLLAALLFYYA